MVLFTQHQYSHLLKEVLMGISPTLQNNSVVLISLDENGKEAKDGSRNALAVIIRPDE